MKQLNIFFLSSRMSPILNLTPTSQRGNSAQRQGQRPCECVVTLSGAMSKNRHSVKQTAGQLGQQTLEVAEEG